MRKKGPAEAGRVQIYREPVGHLMWPERHGNTSNRHACGGVGVGWGGTECCHVCSDGTVSSNGMLGTAEELKRHLQTRLQHYGKHLDGPQPSLPQGNVHINISHVNTCTSCSYHSGGPFHLDGRQKWERTNLDESQEKCHYEESHTHGLQPSHVCRDSAVQRNRIE